MIKELVALFKIIRQVRDRDRPRMALMHAENIIQDMLDMNEKMRDANEKARRDGEEITRKKMSEELDVRLMCCNKKMRRCSAMIHDWTTGYGGMVVKASYWCFLCRTKKSVEHIG